MTLRHQHIDGHLYYVTTVTQGRLPLFVTANYVVPLLDSLNFYQWKLNVRIVGYVIMPDHIHLLLWPLGAATVSDFMRDFKTFTAKRIIRQAEAETNQALLKSFEEFGAKRGRSENKVWQDDYWDMHIFSVRFVREKLNYMHRNPVRAELVGTPEDYPYSSYRNYTENDQSWIELKKDWLL